MSKKIDRPTTEEINNVLAGSATNEVAKRVAQWFATPEGADFVDGSMQHDIDNIVEDMEDVYVDHNISSLKMLDKINQDIEHKRNRRILYRIAAVFLPVAFISVMAAYLASPNQTDNVEYTNIYIAKGEQKSIELSDGTIVALNSDTHFSYPTEFKGKRREVFLDGEAYFEVEADKSHPFIIGLDNSNVIITGTKFNINAYKSDKNIVVALYEGAMSFNIIGGESCDLTPGEMLSYAKASNNYLLSDNKGSKEPAWRDHNIIFDNSSLAEIVQTLERWYDVKFIIKSPQFIDNKYSLTLENASIEDVLYDLGKISPLYFEYNVATKTVTATARY